MGQFDFTYELPHDFDSRLTQLLKQGGHNDIVQAFQRSKYEFEEIDYAYYAGIPGDNWNKKAIDFTFVGTQKDIELLQLKNKLLKENIQKALRATVSGYIVRNILYLISDDSLEITLPEEYGETFETLSSDIYDALNKNEPTLVLDRLHTYSTKFLREICNKHNISVADERGNNYPLHSLAGALSKYYKENNVFQSEFAEQVLKMSISTFEKYNVIRNQQSYAHDNKTLNKDEATYVVTVIAATLTLIQKIETN